ncbi:MAG TPA: hypothetical protein VHF47_09790 [Acidimicrobiales bacterium]|nr:hypothetical protein [Acidimicrobiales bacterium]
MRRRRRLAALLATALTASTLAVLATAQPAAATQVCAGAGTAVVGSPGLFYPGAATVTFGTGTHTTTTTIAHIWPKLLVFAFSFAGGIGTCAPNVTKGLSAAGQVAGWCGHSWGTGITNNGFRFAWVSAGSMLLITGGLVGVINAVPNALAGESCTSGALNFLVTGAVVKVHCTFAKTKTDTLIIFPRQEFLTTTPYPPPFTGLLNTHLIIPEGNYHVWYKLCAGVL